LNHPALLPLPLAPWQETRDTLHAYSRILGKIRQALTPPQEHWWHASLFPGDGGLTTGAMPISDRAESSIGSIDSMRIALDLTQHAVVVSSEESSQLIPFAGQSVHSLTDAVLHVLNKWGLQPLIDRSLFADATPLKYDPNQARHYGQVLHALAGLWVQFQTELPGKTSPVQLWPHHFDISLVWFSGRNVPGVDPSDVENAAEQTAFGFSTGDDGIPDPYIYITAYPFPDSLTGTALPAPARWHTTSWQGALIPYGELVERSDAADQLLNIFRAVRRAGAETMQA
jgi:hypothetical protein